MLWCSAGDLFAECPIALDKPLTTVRRMRLRVLHCIAHLSAVFILLRQHSAAQVFACLQCVVPVVDSSRYFVLR